MFLLIWLKIVIKRAVLALYSCTILLFAKLMVLVSTNPVPFFIALKQKNVDGLS